MSEAQNLERIYNYLSREEQRDSLYWIPAIWNRNGYQQVMEQDGEILIYLRGYIASVIKRILESGRVEQEQSLDDAVIYNSLVRYTTAWDYNHDGEIETGTFLRMIAILPLLKELGVTILYLLPVTKYSTLKQKGDIGSPYAIKNYFSLDENLHDSLLDGMEAFSLDQEFTALVEACHLLGIQVVHDFIPRVTAVNSDLIYDHPDWVYWIRLEELEGFQPPRIPELGFFEECTPEKLEIVYTSLETPRHLEKFTQPPNILNPELWEMLKLRSREEKLEILELLEREMGITTAPAHSDWINDVQPIWTDITFLRLYMDVNPMVKSFIRADQPPYVMFDTIKCNMYPGNQPNHGLWDMLEQTVHHNMEVYGLDGFRVDIGHTLPVELLSHLFQVIREIKPGALLISEDLINENHKKAALSGYDIMLGNNWNQMSKISKENLNGYLKSLPELQIHIFACAETADTPRITSRDGGVLLARCMAVFNYFMPKGVPYITTGYEVNEEQPLNCGLADNTNGAPIPKAFFNKMTIGWKHQHAESMIGLLKRLNYTRQEYYSLFDPTDFIVYEEAPEDTVVFGYQKSGFTLLCCMNLNMKNESYIDLQLLTSETDYFEILLDTGPDSDQAVSDKPSYMRSAFMSPGQAIVVKL